MKEHLIQLRIKSTMSLETLLANFPPTLMVKNTEEQSNAKGHFPLEVVYVTKVIKVVEML